MSMLALPRELYLIICSHLSPTDLARLAGMSKDYYMSVQEPRFSHINIDSFSKLVKLVGTLTKPPAVSQISARQRLRWQSLSDAQLRERDVKRLNILLAYGHNSGSKPVTGELLSRCIGAISRCHSGVRIRLSLHGPWHSLLSQLQTVSLPDVRELVVYLGGSAQENHSGPRRFNSSNIWELFFSGFTLPDLQAIELDTHHSSRNDLPATLKESSTWNRHEYSRSKPSFTPFHGLKKLKCIKLQYNSLLNEEVLTSLFGSNIIPHNLTNLEIVSCPSLRQTDLPVLSNSSLTPPVSTSCWFANLP